MIQVLTDLFRITLDHWTDFLFLSIGGLTVIAWCIQLFYYFYFFLRIHRYRKVNEKQTPDPVSVIICAKNEADNLRKYLPDVLEQDYPEFQVIVVNDGSQDDTAMVLAEMEKKYKHLYVTRIEHTHPYPHAKKLAQTIGVKAARYDQLLFIDADCRPATRNWINCMQSNFLPKKEIVLGYGAYEKKKGLVNRFIRMDTLWTAQQYFSFAIRGIPYMGCGRNLAYRRSLFFNNKGFANQLHLQSGDDDLFVNQTASKTNTAVEFDPDSKTISEPMLTMNNWLRQKRRHLTAGFYYRTWHRFLIGLELISREYFYLSLIVLLSFWKFPGYLFLLLLVRWIIHLWIVKLTMNRLKEDGLWLFSLIYDLFMPAISGFLVMKTKLSKTKKFNW
ncbi:MAG: glycosyltransferase [Bacteroidales bacterium]|jgi:glycosyltransferase involved in cell wall biosynthesis